MMQEENPEVQEVETPPPKRQKVEKANTVRKDYQDREELEDDKTPYFWKMDLH